MGDYYVEQLYYLTLISFAIITVPGVAAALYWWKEDRARTNRRFNVVTGERPRVEERPAA